MFTLVNQVADYPARFDWCEDAQVIESDDEHMIARLELGLGGLRTWFTTENTWTRPHHIDLRLVDGPFRSLSGHWEFHALDECACKVSLTLKFQPKMKLLGPAMTLGFQGLADRMVDDFVRIADLDEAGLEQAGLDAAVAPKHDDPRAEKPAADASDADDACR